MLLLVLRTYFNILNRLWSVQTLTKCHKNRYRLSIRTTFFDGNANAHSGSRLGTSLCVYECVRVCAWKSNANLGSLCPTELHVCVSAGWFGRLMSGQLSGHLARTKASTLRHVAVNDCFISLRQRWVVTTRGVVLCVRVRAIGKGGLNSCGQKMDTGRYQI